MSEQEKILKNIVIAIRSDSGGTGLLRTQFIMDYLTSAISPSGTLIPIITHVPIMDHNILLHTRSINFQRYMTPAGINTIETFKRLQPKYGFKMLSDIDDFVFNNPDGGTALPEYNFLADNIKSPEYHDACITMYNMLDELTVSTQHIKDFLENNGVTTKITILPNTVCQYFYGKQKRKIINPLIKPKVIYSGSPTHYHNGKKLLGDFSKEWVNWIINNVNNDKIEFTIMGGLPFFLEPIKDKIKIIDWVNPHQYHLVLQSIKPDIAIMPLVPNMFNYCKSDIKYIEACAVNAVGIGTIFNNGKPSPYDKNVITVSESVTEDQLNICINNLKDPETFNKVLEVQRNYLDYEGRYLESAKNINRLLEIY